MDAVRPDSTYKEFIFESYAFDHAASSLALRYRYADGPSFEEVLVFEGAERSLSLTEREALDRAFRLIFLLSGVSYYKAFVPPTLRCAAFALDSDTASFMEKVYRKGLAEFTFRNNLDLRDRIQFLCDAPDAAEAIRLSLPHRTCVPVGGGKDSIVTLECLKRAQAPIVLFSLGNAEPISRTIAIAQLPFIRVRRSLDRRLFALNEQGALNGHVPITGILSAITIACAIIYGFDAVAMSNENSASAPNVTVDNLEVNHQYSKSLEFEADFANYVNRHISPDIKYFSFLRPLSEIAIAKRFARYAQYFGDFRSCNKAFKQIASQRATQWCCDCPKCRFVFLALAPFVPKAQLVDIFGADLLDDRRQLPGFSELCGIRAFKPFECVGEVEESRSVLLHLAQKAEWKSDVVVRSLLPDLEASSDVKSSYESLFDMKLSHRVPEDFLAILNACQ
jgi:hypothetical protein